MTDPRDRWHWYDTVGLLAVAPVAWLRAFIRRAFER